MSGELEAVRDELVDQDRQLRQLRSKVEQLERDLQKHAADMNSALKSVEEHLADTNAKLAATTKELEAVKAARAMDLHKLLLRQASSDVMNAVIERVMGWTEDERVFERVDTFSQLEAFIDKMPSVDAEKAREKKAALASARAEYRIDDRVEGSLKAIKRLGNTIAHLDIFSEYGTVEAAVAALQTSVDATLPATFTSPRDGPGKPKQVSKSDGLRLVECFERVFQTLS